MAKSKKKAPVKKLKKPGKYDTTLKLNMSFEDAVKMLGTPIKKKK
jgi:hypothetical protein